LGLASSALGGQLARYEKLPALIAEHDTIQNLVRNPSAQNVPAVNQYLQSINNLLESSDIYLMNDEGMTIAASNYNEQRPFVGENFSYRPYFFDAIAGDSGRFFALGTTSGKRGYYFSAPVMVDGQARGVLAFKVDMDVIERSWHGNDFEIIVTDPEGIIFMSGRPDWLFKSIGPLTADQIARTAHTRRYAETPLIEIPVRSTQTDRGDTLLEIDDAERTIEYLILSEEIRLIPPCLPSCCWLGLAPWPLLSFCRTAHGLPNVSQPSVKSRSNWSFVLRHVPLNWRRQTTNWQAKSKNAEQPSGSCGEHRSN